MITYIDLGAHSGAKAAAYAQQTAMRIAYLFEPNPRLVVTPIPEVPTEIIRAAVWDQNGTAPFYIGQLWNGEGSSLLAEKTTGALDLAYPVTVPTVDLASWLLALAPPNTEVKFNIEGAEYRVLDRLVALHVFDQVDIRAVHWSHHAAKIGRNPAQMTASVEAALASAGFHTLTSSPFGRGFITYRRAQRNLS